MQAGQVIAFGSIPELLERYVQLDVQLPRHASVQNSVIRAISRQQDRACVLLDRWSRQRQSLEQLGAEVLGETSLTLEELFIALDEDRSRALAAEALCRMNRTILALLLDYHRRTLGAWVLLVCVQLMQISAIWVH